MRKTILAIAVILGIAVPVFFAWHFTRHPKTGSISPESITIGTSTIIRTLIYIAEDRGFFAENGLEVAVKECLQGLDAVSEMTKGEVDISLSAELPIVAAAFKKENISIIGNIQNYQFAYLIARKDRGIERASDLKGKKIGVARGTILEFYLGRLLYLHGISMQDIEIKYVHHVQAREDVLGGSIDAALILSNSPSSVKLLSDNRFAAWPAQSGRRAYDVLACRKDWIASHSEAINKLLRALARAEEYLAAHQIEGKEIVRKRLSCDDAFLTAIWPDRRFSLTLDQSIVLAMEDEARWMIDNNLTESKQVPDFLDYICEGYLEAIKPGAVNIIREKDRPWRSSHSKGAPRGKAMRIIQAKSATHLPRYPFGSGA